MTCSHTVSPNKHIFARCFKYFLSVSSSSTISNNLNKSSYLQDTVRVSKRDLATAAARGIPGPLDMWHHVDCFCKEDKLKDLAWPSMGVASAIPGFDSLKPDDQKELQKKLG